MFESPHRVQHAVLKRGTEGSAPSQVPSPPWFLLSTGLAGERAVLGLILALSPCRYMKYLYPYECEKRALSSPGELQAAIDSNRREGRRQTFGTTLFNYSPAGTPTLLGSPKMHLPALSISAHSCNQLSQVHAVKKGG